MAKKLTSITKAQRSEFIRLPLGIIPTGHQIEIARVLKIDIKGDTSCIAATRILDAVALAVGGTPRLPETDTQAEWANRVGIDSRNDSRRVAWARIAEKLHGGNVLALSKLKPEAGETILITEVTTAPSGEQFASKELGIISSVKLDGKLYLKKGGRRALVYA